MANTRHLPLFALGLLLASAVPSFVATPQALSQVTSSQSSAPASNVAEKKEEVKDTNDEYRHSPIVQKFGHALGMSTEKAATAFELFNFLVLLAGVGYLVLKMVPKAFRKRTSDIQKRLVEARSATEEASARLNSVEERLSKLDEQIAAMRTQADHDAVRDEQRIKAGVEEEKAKILAAADAEIQSATALARREIQKYAAELAIEQAARQLVVSAETDRLLVQSFAYKLGGSKGEGN